MERLEKAFDTNSVVFRDGLLTLTVMVEALMSALDDLARGCVQWKTQGTDGAPHVDFQHYISLRQRAEAEAQVVKEEPPTLIESPDNDEIRIFGGE